MIFDKNGTLLDIVSVPLEHGDISTTSGTGYVLNELTNIDAKFRTAFPVEVIPSSIIKVSVSNDSANVSSITVIEYTSAFSMIKASVVSNGKVTLSSTTKYIKAIVSFSSSGYNPRNLLVSGVQIVKNPKIRSGYEKYVLEVADGIYTSACLILPPNYSVDGDPVPLLTYIHGSNGYVTWDANMGVMLDNSTYYPYMEYLRDEGFAILDVYGWTSKYKTTADTQNTSTEPNKSNTFVTPITYSAFLRGMQYALDRYNLDENRVSVYCKSLGGGIANLFAIRNDIPLTAICELAPTIDVLFWDGWGQSSVSRSILADIFGFTGNVESVFATSGFNWRSTNGKAFMDANLDKMMAFNPGWYFDGMTLSAKYQDSYDKDYTNTSNCRYVKYPVKIWVAPDDTNISYNKILEFVAQCKNTASDITLRTMPENTGGHHSVDNDANAPKSSGTTALGIAYADIPTAYVEMVEFIRSR